MSLRDSTAAASAGALPFPPLLPDSRYAGDEALRSLYAAVEETQQGVLQSQDALNRFDAERELTAARQDALEAKIGQLNRKMTTVLKRVDEIHALFKTHLNVKATAAVKSPPRYRGGAASAHSGDSLSQLVKVVDGNSVQIASLRDQEAASRSKFKSVDKELGDIQNTVTKHDNILTRLREMGYLDGDGSTEFDDSTSSSSAQEF